MFSAASQPILLGSRRDWEAEGRPSTRVEERVSKSVDWARNVDFRAGLHYLENIGNASAPAFVEVGGCNNATFAAVDSESCPDSDVPDCLAAACGELCRADEWCGTEWNLNNCDLGSGWFGYDIYEKQCGAGYAASPFEGIDFGSYSSPTLADLDSDSDWDLVVGAEHGGLHLCGNQPQSLGISRHSRKRTRRGSRRPPLDARRGHGVETLSA